MRSKTSSFNKTLFRKNLSRFAPIWAGYLACLLLGMVLLVEDKADFWRANNFASLCGVSGLINVAFAFLVAAVLFGDLYVSRMCNALHAMPVTRDSWFTTNLVTGFLFSLVPTTIMSLCSIPFLAPTPVENAWAIGLYWLAVTNLQYLFFFGLATLCAFCVGSRVGLAALYAVVNVASFLLLVLVEYLYIPMHHGVIAPQEPFILLCPAFWFSNNTCFVDMRSWQVETAPHNYEIHGAYTLDSGSWIYLFVLAAIGVVLLVLARQLYRKRDLECAGDLVAFRKLSPVAAVFGAFGSAVAFLIFYQMAGTGSNSPFVMYGFLFLGLATGWFAAKMLLERNLQVFRKENVKGLLLLAAILGGSLIVNYLDPLGIEKWVPDADKVESVTLENGYRATIALTDKEDISDILALHAFSAEQKLTDDMIQQERELAEATGDGREYNYPRYLYYNLQYKLTNGWTSRRQYRIRISDAPSDIIRRHTSSLESLFYYGETYGEGYGENRVEKVFSPDTREELLSYAQEPLGIQIGQVNVPKAKLTEQTVIDLFNAIADDCEEGTLAQDDNFHPIIWIINHDSEEYYDDLSAHAHSSFYLRITLNQNLSIGLNFFLDSQHINAWAEDMGITLDDMIRKYYDVKEYEIQDIPFNPGFEVSPYSYAPVPTAATVG